MADEKQERKIVLEREYIVPLRDSWLRAQKYKRGKRAVKAIREFLVKHMKVYDRDLRKIRIDILLNNEIRFRGMQKPPAKIKVRATKYDDGEVVARLVEIPKHIEFELARKAKKMAEKLIEKKDEKVQEKPVEEKKEESKETKEDSKEKEASSKIAEQAIEKAAAKQEKHTSKTSQQAPKIQRKALKK
jgi:large subunit ribosomal protein L31e